MTSVARQRVALLTHAFGFDPHETQHHFLVSIPRGAAGKIEISEHFSWDEARGSGEVSYGTPVDGQIRVVLPRLKWDVIADEVRAQFNGRLRRMNLKLGGWKAGPNLLRRELGKELVLLAWAIEDADSALIPAALANWGGLAPEERWWLYTQTAGATGHGINDRGRGWRKAVRYALTENPVTVFTGAAGPVPEYFQVASAGPLFAGSPDRIEDDEDVGSPGG
jgi:hypothetical protein